MPKAEIMCFRNNVDYSGSGATWGCHESYAHRKPLADLETQIIPHLVTRLIYTGAGGFNPLSRGLEFTLSPRVAHLRHVVSGDSTSNRGIWHTKTEPLGAGGRLHLLCGDSLCSQAAAFLKTSTTALAVALADAGLAPGRDVQLADPLEAMREVAADVTARKPLLMAGGGRRSPLDIQRHYLQMAEAHLGGGSLPAWAAEACQMWRAMLDRLEGAPDTVASTLDWGIKLALYSHYARSLGILWETLPFWNKIFVQLCDALAAAGISEEDRPLERALGPRSPIPQKMVALEPLLRQRGCCWDDLKPVLKGRRKLLELDTRFGQLGDKGLFQALDAAGVLDHRVAGVDNIEQAMTEAPAGGRARIRGQVIQRLAGTENWQCDWEHIVNFHEGQILDLSDPFSREESWRALQPSERSMQRVPIYSPGEENPDYAQGRDRVARRQESTERVLSGDYSGGETLLRGLLQEEFEVAGTRCHLARALMMMNREEEAREEINQAWAARAPAANYVVARILFFRCLFALLDGAAIEPIVEQIQGALRELNSHMDWTILPMLKHLRRRLGKANLLFLEALAGALCDESGIRRLERFPAWRGEVSSTG